MKILIKSACGYTQITNLGISDLHIGHYVLSMSFLFALCYPIFVIWVFQSIFICIFCTFEWKFMCWFMLGPWLDWAKNPFFWYFNLIGKYVRRKGFLIQSQICYLHSSVTSYFVHFMEVTKTKISGHWARTQLWVNNGSYMIAIPLTTVLAKKHGIV